MPLEEWQDTKQTLHRFLQIAGKVRLAQSPLRNHWWNVPFHLTAGGSPPARWVSRPSSPSTPRLTEEPLSPAGAGRVRRGSSHLALLRYDGARASADPRAAVLEFLESAYLAGARRAGWDVDKLRHPRAAAFRASNGSAGGR